MFTPPSHDVWEKWKEEAFQAARLFPQWSCGMRLTTELNGLVIGDSHWSARGQWGLKRLNVDIFLRFDNSYCGFGSIVDMSTVKIEWHRNLFNYPTFDSLLEAYDGLLREEYGSAFATVFQKETDVE